MNYAIIRAPDTKASALGAALALAWVKPRAVVKKGQRARSGVAIKGFEGGQMPIHMRLPKRGFNSRAARDYTEINLGRLQAAIDAGKVDAGKPIDADVLLGAGLLRRIRGGVRLLAYGELKSKLVIEVRGASKAAVAAVEKAGGSVNILNA